MNKGNEKKDISREELYEMFQIIPSLRGVQAEISRKLQKEGLLRVSSVMVHRILKGTVDNSIFKAKILDECYKEAVPFYDEYLLAKSRLHPETA